MEMSSDQISQEGNRFCVSEMNIIGMKCVFQHQNKSKTACEDAAEVGKRVSLSTVKQVLYRHGLKDHSARKKTLLQKQH